MCWTYLQSHDMILTFFSRYLSLRRYETSCKCTKDYCLKRQCRVEICSHCGKRHCEQCTSRCDSCGKSEGCTLKCDDDFDGHNCGRKLCSNCVETCGRCKRSGCNDCVHTRYFFIQMPQVYLIGCNEVLNHGQ